MNIRTLFSSRIQTDDLFNLGGVYYRVHSVSDPSPGLIKIMFVDATKTYTMDGGAAIHEMTVPRDLTLQVIRPSF